MKKIAIDTGNLNSGHKVRGIGVNTQELISSLNKIKQDKFQINAIDIKNADLSNYDLVHYTAFNPYFINLPITKPVKKIILAVHDLIYLLYPNAYPSGLRGKVKFQINKLLLKKVDHVITISEASKQDIIKFLDINPNKISVIYLAPKEIYKQKIFMQTKYKLPEKFVLYVGGVNYNKNLIRLADACKNINTPLVIVGKSAGENNPVVHPENLPFIDFLKKYKDDKEIIRLGFVSDKDLAVIYKKASVYCQPSLAEGFGLNSLEAMVSGTPVVASDIPVHREVLGDSCLFFDLNKTVDLEEKLKLIMNDRKIRNSLVEKGNIQAGKYSWENTAQSVIQVYEKVLKI